MNPLTGQEDCLFLNVWTWTNETSLPVIVWTHGEGYGQGNARADPTYWMSLVPSERFVFIAIQYRLGAFGFLSSAEVKDRGVVKAGLLDQTAALQWVQSHIYLFGGDASRVTFMGESAGAGSVMHQILAYDGTLGTRLFHQSIAASPYLPMQHRFDGAVPTHYYHRRAVALNCTDTLTLGNTLFDCLKNASSAALAAASNNVSFSQTLYGRWSYYRDFSVKVSPISFDTIQSRQRVADYTVRKLNALL